MSSTFTAPAHFAEEATALASASPSRAITIADIAMIVSRAVESALGGPVASDQPLMDAGLDSLGGTELQQELAESLGLPLPPTLIFDYPTIDALTAHLHALTSGQSEAVGLAPTHHRQTMRSGTDAAVIMGMSGVTFFMSELNGNIIIGIRELHIIVFHFLRHYWQAGTP